MQKTVNVSNPEQEPIYGYFTDRQDGGHFDRYPPDLQTFANHIWNKNLGVAVAMSHSGIGEDVTNGFIQFICNDPMMQVRLLSYLTDVRDSFKRNDQPSIEIRSKSVPNVKNPVWYDGVTHYITVMFRTPRFRSKSHANQWWSMLAIHVTQTRVGETAA